MTPDGTIPVAPVEEVEEDAAPPNLGPTLVPPPAAQYPPPSAVEERSGMGEMEKQKLAYAIARTAFLALPEKYGTTRLGIAMAYVHTTLGTTPNVIANGQVVGPLSPEDVLLYQQFDQDALTLGACQLIASGRF